MKEIKLSKGKIAIVDDNVFKELSRYKWHYSQSYARRTAGRGSVFMHRQILGLSPNDNLQTDHINQNTLDNRRENLRVATASQNSMNVSKTKKNSSGYKGVSWNKQRGKWKASLRANKKSIYLGYFDKKEEAALAYNNAAIKYFKEFASLNILLSSPSVSSKKKLSSSIYLTLSRAKTSLEKILVLADIFMQWNPALNKYELIAAKDLWEILNKNGIIVHPSITAQYLKGQACIYCGGQVITLKGVTDKRWEQRCSICGYLFAEEGASEQTTTQENQPA